MKIIKAILISIGIAGACYMFGTAGMSQNEHLEVSEIIGRVIISVVMICIAWLGCGMLARLKNTTENKSDRRLK